MIAIAESGSTKTAWFIIKDRNGVSQEFMTQGFNPDFHTAKDVEKSLELSTDIQKVKAKVRKVYFFGASCSSPKNVETISNALGHVFNFCFISVEHDLLACAYALSEGESLITCILGTGSNSAYFDGHKMVEEVPALGVFMGDEGSGAYYGKRFIRDYFYKQIPKEITEELEKDHNLKWDEVRKIVYGSNQGNVYLASFMPIIYRFYDHPYIKNLIQDGIDEFIKIHVDCFKDYPTKKVGFVGSLAHLFQELIKERLSSKGYQLKKVIKSPGINLVDYLIKNKGILEETNSFAAIQ